MQIEFIGAAGGVTGSKHLLHINGKKILLDCGMFQGHRKKAAEANRYFPLDATDIDAVVLSHAHIDHSGLIPLLVKKGFTGSIYCTHATRDLCAIMLQDSAYIQEHDAEYLAKKKNIPAEPLYTVEDARKAITLFRSVDYEQEIHLFPGVRVIFRDAGHILGAAMEEWIIDDEDTNQTIRFGFTGDLWRKNLPILKDPEQLKDLDILLTESTYGNRFHDEILNVEEKFGVAIQETIDKGGKVYIPAFAVERTQEILYILKDLISKGKIDEVPIYIDSPLATNATEVFKVHPECYDDELLAMRDSGVYPFLEDKNVRFTKSVQESKNLNNIKFPAIIIAASGMCEFGRIVHHLKANLSDPKNMLAIVGYMAQNTLGRKLIEGEKVVNIHGDPVQVNATIKKFNAFSAHADRNDLLDFAKNAGDDLKNIFIIHGEQTAQQALKEGFEALPNTKNTEVFIPMPGEVYQLFSGKRFHKTNKTNMECQWMVCKI